MICCVPVGVIDLPMLIGDLLLFLADFLTDLLRDLDLLNILFLFLDLLLLLLDFLPIFLPREIDLFLDLGT